LKIAICAPQKTVSNAWRLNKAHAWFETVFAVVPGGMTGAKQFENRRPGAAHCVMLFSARDILCQSLG
jgi:hypothetical protein